MPDTKDRASLEAERDEVDYYLRTNYHTDLMMIQGGHFVVGLVCKLVRKIKELEQSAAMPKV